MARYSKEFLLCANLGNCDVQKSVSLAHEGAWLKVINFSIKKQLPTESFKNSPKFYSRRLSTMHARESQLCNTEPD